MHFRILNMIATSGLQKTLECTEFAFGWAVTQTPLGQLTALWRPIAVLLGDPTSKGKGGEAK